jgi:hypothetical protein|tara:strand:- start:67 stop:252 length:186 start_codon:yes stop_codon:yes gene_type:complete
MEMKEQCEAFNIKLTDIAEETGFSLPYVGMVLSGKRNNNQILSAIHLALEAKKAKLRNLIN